MAMTAGRGFALGLAAGLAVAAGAGLVLRQANDGPEPIAVAPAPPEAKPRESPWADVPPQRRTYTLSLNNPDVVPVSSARHLRPDDVVVGIVVGRHARAYPWWVLSQYHVVNDTVNRVPVYVGLCEVCSGASAFLPVVNRNPIRRPLNRVLQMDFGEAASFTDGSSRVSARIRQSPPQ